MSKRSLLLLGIIAVVAIVRIVAQSIGIEAQMTGNKYLLVMGSGVIVFVALFPLLMNKESLPLTRKESELLDAYTVQIREKGFPKKKGAERIHLAFLEVITYTFAAAMGAIGLAAVMNDYWFAQIAGGGFFALAILTEAVHALWWLHETGYKRIAYILAGYPIVVAILLTTGLDDFLIKNGQISGMLFISVMAEIVGILIIVSLLIHKMITYAHFAKLKQRQRAR